MKKDLLSDLRESLSAEEYFSACTAIHAGLPLFIQWWDEYTVAFSLCETALSWIDVHTPTFLIIHGNGFSANLQERMVHASASAYESRPTKPVIVPVLEPLRKDQHARF